MFIIREQANPTTSFDVIYDQAIGRVAGACMTLVSKALERSADDPEVRVRGFAVLGQIVAFRAARGAALRSLGWPDFNGERLAILKKAMRDHKAAALRRTISEERSVGQEWVSTFSYGWDAYP